MAASLLNVSGEWVNRTFIFQPDGTFVMKSPDIPRARTREGLRKIVLDWRKAGLRIGFVPTMGALHQGHLSLVTRALETCDRVVASIFVNPTQFAEGEDLDVYPRDEDADCAKLAAVGCHLAYCPELEEMYPEGSLTNVRVEELSDLLDGGPRPHFFYGVATIVARLFIHVRPDLAVFGEKDFQQLQIIRRMTRDLGFEIEIIGGETVRDADGLAQSSRNLYLTPDDRRGAGGMFAALHRARCRIEAGGNIEACLQEARDHLAAAGFATVDYVKAVDPDTLRDIDSVNLSPGFEGRLLGAGWMGKTRLIDNLGFQRKAVR
ncbi:MAG: pantoate--beta-alanine ligase [Pseudomonadota bacterium]